MYQYIWGPCTRTHKSLKLSEPQTVFLRKRTKLKTLFLRLSYGNVFRRAKMMELVGTDSEWIKYWNQIDFKRAFIPTFSIRIFYNTRFEYAIKTRFNSVSIIVMLYFAFARHLQWKLFDSHKVLLLSCARGE